MNQKKINMVIAANKMPDDILHSAVLVMKTNGQVVMTIDSDLTSLTFMSSALQRQIFLLIGGENNEQIPKKQNQD